MEDHRPVNEDEEEETVGYYLNGLTESVSVHGEKRERQEDETPIS